MTKGHHLLMQVCAQLLYQLFFKDFFNDAVFKKNNVLRPFSHDCLLLQNDTDPRVF